MEIGGVAIGASTVTSVFTATLRISQAVYELKAVGEQTRDLLDTTKHIDDSMRNVRIVRRQKSALLTLTEKDWIDREIRNSEKAVRDVAALIEPGRVDMQTGSNNTKDIKFKNRVMFVLRDSPNVAIQLTKLSIATQGLNAAMGVLCNRESRGVVTKMNGGTVKRVDRRSSSPTRKPPPSYELSEFINRRRTTSAVPRQKDMNYKSFGMCLVDENRPGDESITLSTSRSQGNAARYKQLDDRRRARKLVLNMSRAEATEKKKWPFHPLHFSSVPRDAPYLDRFDKSPACIPVLTCDDATPLVPTKAYNTPEGNDTDVADAWRVETRQAFEQNQNLLTPASTDRRSANYHSPNSFGLAGVSRIPLDSGPARIAIPRKPLHDQRLHELPGESLRSYPPLVTHKSEPSSSTMSDAYLPPAPHHPVFFQPHYSRTSSVQRLQSGFHQSTSVRDPLLDVPRASPFHFLVPEMGSGNSGTSATAGRGEGPRPSETTHVAPTNSPPRPHHPSLPYPYFPPSTIPFPASALAQAPSDPLPQHSTPPQPQPPPPWYPVAASRPDPPPGPSLADTVSQRPNLLFYKPLPDIPFSRHLSVTSPNSEPPTGAGAGVFGEPRVSRGRIWLEHHAERTFATRELAGGPLSGGFLAPFPPQSSSEER